MSLTTNQLVRQINDHVQAGKPAYWEKPGASVRPRIIRARVKAGKFQVKTFSGWVTASETDKIDLAR